MKRSQRSSQRDEMIPKVQNSLYISVKVILCTYKHNLYTLIAHCNSGTWPNSSLSSGEDKYTSN